MPPGQTCREIIFAAQHLRNYPHRRGNFERGKTASLVAKRQFGRHLCDDLGEGNCKSTIAARQSGVNFAAMHEMSRRALWVSVKCRDIFRPKATKNDTF